MKKRLLKSIAIALILSTLLSIFAVFSFAAEDAETGEVLDTLNLMVNRNFEEGWDTTNGLSGQYKKQSFTIEYEERADYTYNHFAKIEAVHFGASDNDAFMQFSDDKINTGGTVLEYDIKSDCYTNVGNCYFLTPYVNAERTYCTVFTVFNNEYKIDNGNRFDGKPDLTVGSINEWVHIANVYNFDRNLRVCASCKSHYYGETPIKNEYNIPVSDKCPKCNTVQYGHTITITTYFGYSDTFDADNAINVSTVSGSDYDLNKTYYVDSYCNSVKGALPSIDCFRIGITGLKEEYLGQSFLIDNVKFYNDRTPKDENGNPSLMDVRSDITVESHGYGSMVSQDKLPTVQLQGSSQGASNVKARENAMYMKTGSDYMLYREQRIPIFQNKTSTAYGAPVKVDGIVYVPFEPLLNVTGYPVFAHDDGLQYDISTAGGASVMTLYRDVAIVDGERVHLTAAPFMAQDPDDPNNAYPVIAIDDLPIFFPGYYVTYDEMGLIGIAETDKLFDRTDITYMTTLMKKFVFDDVTEEELYALVEKNTNGFTHPYIIASDEQFEFLNSVYKAHLAKEKGESYDETLLDDSLYGYLVAYVKSADALVKKFTTLPDPSKAANYTYLDYAYKKEDGKKYKHLAYEITNPFYGIKEGVLYTDSTVYGWDYAGPADENGNYWGKLGIHYNDGYDWAGSRNGFGVTYATYAQQLALAYHITGDIMYAELAYDVVISLCDEDNWHNWSQKHHLSCAEMMLYLGLTYDWMYNVWTEIQADRDAKYSLAYITQCMYRKSTFYSYENSRYGRHVDVWTRDSADSTRDTQGRILGIWNWSTTTINWNPVCNSGVAIGALAILGEDSKLEGVDFTADGEDGANRVTWCATNNMKRLWMYGLEQYAPDGSYIEGAGYWAYATNYLAKLMWAVNTAAGDDLGFFEAWGMDKTFYFAVTTEYQVYSGKNQKYTVWAFHDCGGGAQDTQMFFFAADMLGDNGLAAIRIDQLNNGKSITWEDILGYKPEYSGLDLEDIQMDLDYRFESLEGVMSRSSYEVGGTIAGIMGNPNNCGNHGQMDSGMFTYIDDGYEWFPDLGSDEYNVYEYWGYGIRQFYYRNSSEGHNQVILLSQPEAVPFGQSYNGNGVITTVVSEDAGMYAILDNTTAYSGFANFARRGLLMTNNRETVVIQDEMSFGGAETVAWIGHTMASNITLSEDKRTAYLSEVVNAKLQYVRVSMVSNDSSLKFEIMTCGIKADMSDTLLEGIHDKNYSVSHGGVNERGRTAYKRLVIKSESSLAFNCAVVIEDVTGIEDTKPVGYKFVNMNTWHEGAIKESYDGGAEGDGSDGGADSNVVDNAKIADIRNYGNQAKKLIESGYALSTRVVDFYKSLVRVNSAVNTFRPESFKNIPQVWESYQLYLGYLALYKQYSGAINKDADGIRSIAQGLGCI